ncbi:hypothetical protein [Phenylobacterium sp.]|uniref:hypothetical protein n=1 Tax=Phenylobacterium sp. TaxID=1871053 RepID=UPI002F3F7296
MILALMVTTSLLAAGDPPASASTSAPTPVANPTAGPAYAPAKASEQKDTQLVCKSEPVLGSRLPVRRCRTVGDIKDRSLQDRQEVEHAQQNLQIRGN